MASAPLASAVGVVGRVSADGSSTKDSAALLGTLLAHLLPQNGTKLRDETHVSG
jgi:hypothetical protein